MQKIECPLPKVLGMGSISLYFYKLYQLNVSNLKNHKCEILQDLEFFYF